ncbi:NUDIX hydrolase [uncultured Variovorax sp.]|uniref:NUDIX domain-containing protein n=1 Tax=uncultured Variovorax sp. TaxID=114708 RepID=UPI0025DF1544|nr:NUDIX hydrolase [uncultured Variovorax sp.]
MTTKPTDTVDSHLKEELLSREELFEGKFLKARRDTIRLPDGHSATREYVLHPGAVVVIPLLDDGRVVLERQFRYPVGHVMIEFPAGKLDAGEDPFDCGRRELIEETGYTAREWAYAGAMHLAVAYSTEIIHIYFARGLSLGERQLDHGEFLDVFTATPDELVGWCREGKVTDAKTLTCTLWLQNVLSGAWALDWQAPPAQDSAG